MKNGYTLVVSHLVYYETLCTAGEEDDADHIISVQGPSFYITVPLGYFVALASSKQGHNQIMVMLHSAMEIVVKALR